MRATIIDLIGLFTEKPSPNGDSATKPKRAASLLTDQRRSVLRNCAVEVR